MITTSFMNAKRNFVEIIGKLEINDKEEIIITKYKKSIAVIISYKKFEDFKKIENYFMKQKIEDMSEKELLEYLLKK